MVDWGQLPKRHTYSVDGMTRSRKCHISLLNGLGLDDAKIVCDNSSTNAKRYHKMHEYS
jgi:hypothetical protein